MYPRSSRRVHKNRHSSDIEKKYNRSIRSCVRLLRRRYTLYGKSVVYFSSRSEFVCYRKVGRRVCTMDSTGGWWPVSSGMTGFSELQSLCFFLSLICLPITDLDPLSWDSVLETSLVGSFGLVLETPLVGSCQCWSSHWGPKGEKTGTKVESELVSFILYERIG